ncbi:hypothetical protein OCAE111667_09150 [Occultella aeris]|uniref:Uncharacterized protein n=1 Tax=Occultella aeris TaxID=2761496 RepID=A0A7M4DJV1_9MICO|nr:hypothetical protein [Occultella aeris]VZO37336.1 hypothetical protein HALOF300_02409 [Occultella aeris]
MAREVQNRVLDLADQALALPITREQCPDWLRRPGRAECGDLWDTVCSVYRKLTGLELPEFMPSRERRSLDAVVGHPDGSRRVVEVDEAQHFNVHRALTLEHYPPGMLLAFDSAVWRERCMTPTKLRGGGWGKAKPPLFPQDYGRHLQRAFRDMLADLLPPAHGWAPTLRIAHFEVEGWVDEPGAVDRMRTLLQGKLGLENAQTVG